MKSFKNRIQKHESKFQIALKLKTKIPCLEDIKHNFGSLNH